MFGFYECVVYLHLFQGIKPMDEAQIICLNFTHIRCVQLVYGHAGKYVTVPSIFFH